MDWRNIKANDCELDGLKQPNFKREMKFLRIEFLKINGTFFALPVYEESDAMNQSIDF